MPEPKELSKPSALDAARGWSARAREQRAKQPSCEEVLNIRSRLLSLWRETISVGDAPNDFDRHIDALVEFGRAVRETGWQALVDQLDTGTEDTRRLAVDFIRLVVSGEREDIAELDREFRVTAEGFDVLALANQIVVHELVGLVRPVRVPMGWEGQDPDREVRTVDDLLAWFDQQLAQHDFLSKLPHWSNDGAVLRNARRLMDELHIFCDAPRAVGQLSSVEVENQLRDLKAVCQQFATGSSPNGSGKKKAKPGRKLSCDPAKDRAFVNAWERAKGSGVKFKDFCKDHKITVKEGKKIQARVRVRNK